MTVVTLSQFDPTTGGVPPVQPGGTQVGVSQLDPNQSPEQALLSQLQGTDVNTRDAYAALSTLFSSYGLSSLAPKILDYLQQGFGSDTITTLLQQSSEYQARFSGNQDRISNGLQVLTPAEYLATEASYRQLLQAAGLDPAFMNQQQYAEWIGKDISPTEIQDRVNMAVQATTTATPSVLQGFAQLGAHAGDLVSYFLNDRNPMPQLQLKLNQAQIIGAGLQTGVPTTNAAALQFAQQGVTYQQAQNAYQKVAAVLPTAAELSQIYRSQNPYDANTAEQEFLGQSGQAQFAREQLARQETASFSGTSAVGQKSFAPQAAGTGF